MSFIKAYRESESMELIKQRPSAFILLYIIAMRAKRTSSLIKDGLEIGECYLGDFKTWGSTRQQYRTDLHFLKDCQILTIKTTNKGTIVKLLDKTIFDINEEDITTKPTNDQPTANQRLTTNKNDKNEKNEKKDTPPTPTGDVYKMDTECIQDVRVGKDSIGEYREDKYMGQLKKIIEYWNTIRIDRAVKNDTVIHSKPIMRQCARVTDLLEKIFIQKAKKYTIEEMKQAIDNYAREICLRDSSSSYKEHRFFLNEFLKQSNGLEKFIMLTPQKDGSETN